MKKTDAASFKYVRLAFVIMMIAMIVAVQLFPPSLTVSAAGGQTYYVSPNGNDSNPGTLSSPWRTIQRAANTLVAGDTVLVRSGIYKEFVTIKTSGSKTNGYITFQAYPGEKPVIDGSELSMASGSNALIYINNAGYIVVDGFELRNLKTSSSSQSPYGIKVQKSGTDIHLLNNNIHHIENSSSNGNAHGIHILGTLSEPLRNIRISGNEVHHLATGSSESVTLSGNIDGFVVENNIIHDNNNIGIDIAGHYGACSSPCTDQARNGIVAGNTVYNIDTSVNPSYSGNSAAGIYADGSANVVIERNRVFANDFGISIASEKKGKNASGITVRNNYIYHNDQAGIIMGGSGTSNGGATDIKIFNNTIVENDVMNKGYGAIAFQYHVQNAKIANNIMYNRSKKMFVQKYNGSGSDITVDYNLYFRPDGENSSAWVWNDTSYRTWNDLKAATGFDKNSIFADPKFVNVSGYDVHLQSGSPAVDKGLSAMAGGTVDLDGAVRIQGQAVDMGAYEFKAGTQPTPSATPSPTPSATPSPTPSATPSPTPTPATGGTIKIDGNFSDWSNIPSLAEGQSNVRSIKTLAEGGSLNVLVTGSLLEEKGQLFINTDNNAGTGFKAPYWSNSGADYLLENGFLYKYTGTKGTDWSWSEVRVHRGTDKFALTNTVLEVSLALSDLGVPQGGAISIGYVWKDSADHKLPNGRDLLKYVVSKPSTPDPAPSSPAFSIDGSGAEWSGIPVLSSGASNPKLIKAANDKDYLYLLIEGSVLLNAKTQIYLNTDNNVASGYQSSKRSAGGADYLIENGTLYQYTGQGSEWSWKRLIALKSIAGYALNESLVEAAVPLKELGITDSSAIGIGVVLNDSAATQLPASGGLAVYPLTAK